MKATVLVAALFLISCNSQQSDKLTQQQMDQINSELNTIGDSVTARYQRLDAVGVLEYYSPDLVVATDEGVFLDFQTYKKAWIDLNNAVATVKVTSIRGKRIYPANDVFVSTAVFKDETTLKSGDKITYDQHTFTLVYKKIAGSWKVIYSHASGIPVMQKPGKN